MTTMFDKLLDLVAGVPVAANLRIEIERIREKYAELETSNVKLEEENAELRRQLAEALHDAEHEQSKENFVRYKGVLWERDHQGAYSDTPICPDCLIPMASAHRVFPYSCSRCKFQADFNKGELRNVMAGLPNQ